LDVGYIILYHSFLPKQEGSRSFFVATVCCRDWCLIIGLYATTNCISTWDGIERLLTSAFVLGMGYLGKRWALFIIGFFFILHQYLRLREWVLRISFFIKLGLLLVSVFPSDDLCACKWISCEKPAIWCLGAMYLPSAIFGLLGFFCFLRFGD